MKQVFTLIAMMGLTSLLPLYPSNANAQHIHVSGANPIHKITVNGNTVFTDHTLAVDSTTRGQPTVTISGKRGPSSRVTIHSHDHRIGKPFDE